MIRLACFLANLLHQLHRKAVGVFDKDKVQVRIGCNGTCYIRYPLLFQMGYGSVQILHHQPHRHISRATYVRFIGVVNQFQVRTLPSKMYFHTLSAIERLPPAYPGFSVESQRLFHIPDVNSNPSNFHGAKITILRTV